MADISQFSLEPPDQHEWERVEGPSSGGSKRGGTPPEGVVYTARVDTFDFSRPSFKGKLSAMFDPLVILGAAADGTDYEAYYVDVNVELYPWRHGSSASDFLAAHGIDAQPNTNQEWADLIESTAGRTFQFEPRWQGKCKSCKTLYKGMDKWPVKDDGTYSSVLTCACGEKVFANIKIKRLVSVLQPEAPLEVIA